MALPEQDRYEADGLDDDVEDDRDMEQLMADRHAADAILDERDGVRPPRRKLPDIMDEGIFQWSSTEVFWIENYQSEGLQGF